MWYAKGGISFLDYIAQPYTEQNLSDRSPCYIPSPDECTRAGESLTMQHIFREESIFQAVTLMLEMLQIVQ